MTTYQLVDAISSEIFRAYDIRGIVTETFTPNNIYTIGVAIGSEALERGEHTVVVGRDGRISGPELLQALIAGVMASGCNVISIDEVTTPILYYATATTEFHSGAMLSGSHNPPDYNGIKIVIAGRTLYGEDIQKIYQRIVQRHLRSGQGKFSQLAIIDNYLERVTGDIKLVAPLKVVIDCGNGVGSKVAPRLFRMLGCEVTELYCEVDGRFPNHHPDPSVPKNLEELIKLVELKKADVGLAFDGDADRVGIVTDQGEIIAADRLLMLFALDFLTRHPGITIPFDVKCTRHLAAQIALHGGVPLMYKTGHSLLKAKMQELGALLAGELSGHIFIKERWFGFDDGIYVAARFLEILTRAKVSAHEIFAKLPNSVSTPELKVAVLEERKFKFMEELIKTAKFPGGKINTMDGVRVDYDDGFGLIRPSNTTPALTMRFEGDSKTALERIKKVFREQLLQLDPKLQLLI